MPTILNQAHGGLVSLANLLELLIVWMMLAEMSTHAALTTLHVQHDFSFR